MHLKILRIECILRFCVQSVESNLNWYKNAIKANIYDEFIILLFQVYLSVVIFQLVSIEDDPLPAMLCLGPAPSWWPPVLAQERHFSWRAGGTVSRECRCYSKHLEGLQDAGFTFVLRVLRKKRKARISDIFLGFKNSDDKFRS